MKREIQPTFDAHGGHALEYVRFQESTSFSSSLKSLEKLQKLQEHMVN